MMFAMGFLRLLIVTGLSCCLMEIQDCRLACNPKYASKQSTSKFGIMVRKVENDGDNLRIFSKADSAFRSLPYNGS